MYRRDMSALVIQNQKHSKDPIRDASCKCGSSCGRIGILGRALLVPLISAPLLPAAVPATYVTKLGPALKTPVDLGTTTKERDTDLPGSRTGKDARVAPNTWK